jgi:hypothetical protein
MYAFLELGHGDLAAKQQAESKKYFLYHFYPRCVLLDNRPQQGLVVPV